MIIDQSVSDLVIKVAWIVFFALVAMAGIWAAVMIFGMTRAD